MYHYDPTTALEELNEEAVLPNPVHLRDMMLRAHLDADHSLEYGPHLRGVPEEVWRITTIGKTVA